MEGDVGFEFGGADEEGSGGDEDGAAVIAGAGIDGGLESRGVECLAIADGAEIADVVDAGSEG